MTDELNNLLITHLQDAHAMERNVLNMLDSMIANTEDPQMKQLLQQHRSETVEHERRVQQRLDELGEGKSMSKDIGASLASVFKGMTDAMRSEKPAKNLRDGYVAEHLEIAGYELLQRIASRAGDQATVDVCERNKKDEYEMARRLGDCWDRAIELTLMKKGILNEGPTTKTGAYGDRSDAAERGATWTGASPEADMGIGLHGTRSTPNTAYDPAQGNVPTEADVSTQTSTPRTRNP